jgi:tetratricopeptide (TPR) repeat protein
MKKKFVFSVMVFLFIAAGVYGQSAAAKAAFDRGRDAQKEKNYDKAIAEYTEAIRLDNKYAAAYGSRGFIYYNVKKEYDRAIADYNEQIRLDPRNASAYYWRASTYDEKGDYDKAIADHTEHIKLNPNDTFAYSMRGYTYEHKKDYTRAIADFETVLRIDPGNKTAKENLARVNDKLAKAPASVTAAASAPTSAAAPTQSQSSTGSVNASDGIISTRSANTAAQAAFDRGTKEKNYNRKIVEFTEAIRLDPNFTYAYSVRGMYYFFNNDFDRAIADQTQAIRLAPNWTDPYYGRAMAYKGKGDIARARADYETIMRLDPNDTTAMQVLAELAPSSMPATPGFTPMAQNNSQSSGPGTADITNMVLNYQQQARNVEMALNNYRNAVSRGSSKSELDRLYNNILNLQQRMRSYREDCNRKGASIGADYYETIRP